VTAPGIIDRIANHAAAVRIQVDVPHQSKQIAVVIHQQRFEAPLEQVTSPVMPAVDPLGVAKGEVLHALGERNIAYLQNQVKVLVRDRR
jgi:hypothetical protein